MVLFESMTGSTPSFGEDKRLLSFPFPLCFGSIKCEVLVVFGNSNALARYSTNYQNPYHSLRRALDITSRNIEPALTYAIRSQERKEGET